MKKLYPLLITQALSETANFYKEHFGFVTVFEQEWYVQLLHEESGVELAFMMPNASNQPADLHPGFSGGGLVYSFETADAAAEYERLKTADVEFVHELRDEEWGQRHFILRDPSGVYVDVVQQMQP